MRRDRTELELWFSWCIFAKALRGHHVRVIASGIHWHRKLDPQSFLYHPPWWSHVRYMTVKLRLFEKFGVLQWKTLTCELQPLSYASLYRSLCLMVCDSAKEMDCTQLGPWPQNKTCILAISLNSGILLHSYPAKSPLDDPRMVVGQPHHILSLKESECRTIKKVTQKTEYYTKEYTLL